MIWLWFFGIWIVLLVLMAWWFVRMGKATEDDAGEFAEDLAESIIQDIQDRRKVKPTDD